MEKCPKDAEDAEVGELCGSAPPHPVRFPVNIGYGKLWKIIKSHGISKAQKSMNLVISPVDHLFPGSC